MPAQNLIPDPCYLLPVACYLRPDFYIRRGGEKMNRRIRVWLLSLAVLGWLLAPAGLARGAPAAAPLPQFKAPNPARFDLTGTITVGPQSIKLNGPGAQSGDSFQQDLTFTPPSGPPITLNQIQI